MRKLIYISLLAFAAAGANAQTTIPGVGIVYATRTPYDLVHPGNYVIDFNNYTPGPAQYTDITESTPFGNVTFDAIPSSNNIEFLGNSNFPFLGSGNLVLYAFNGTFLQDSLLITLPANTFSFGLDLISPVATPEDYKITVYSGNTPLALSTFGVSPSVNNAYTFFGFDSATSPITSIALQIANGIGAGEPTIDNFTVVPEPSTWLAAVLALGVIGFAQRKRLRAGASFAVKKHF
jgi:hypothetical protein